MARIAKRKLPPRDPRLPDAAYSPEGYRYALVRIALPENAKRRAQGLPSLYYDPNGKTPWADWGYKTWRVDEWNAQYNSKNEYGMDLRHWEFFGEEIDIWEGYSDE